MMGMIAQLVVGGRKETNLGKGRSMLVPMRRSMKKAVELSMSRSRKERNRMRGMKIGRL